MDSPFSYYWNPLERKLKDPEQAFQKLQELDDRIKKARKTAVFCPLPKAIPLWERYGAFADRNTPEDRERLRHACLEAQHEPDAEDHDLRVCARELAYDWVGYLIGDQSSKASFYLQEFRARDEVFYLVESAGGNQPPTLRPKTRGQWPSDWKTKRLRWLHRPEDLTVTELELALAIFDWDDHSRASFVWWLRKRPHILWKIHHFLLKRYCFDLLHAFQEALEREEGRLDRPPYRAGELWRCHPRIWGLTGIGVLALAGMGSSVKFFFEDGPWWLILVLGGATFAVFRQLIRVDVFRQNSGVMASDRHGKPRVQKVVRLFLGRALCLAAGTWAVRLLAGGEVSLGRAPLGILGLAVSACLIGALLQWFWEDKAATEPM